MCVCVGERGGGEVTERIGTLTSPSLYCHCIVCGQVCICVCVSVCVCVCVGGWGGGGH